MIESLLRQGQSTQTKRQQSINNSPFALRRIYSAIQYHSTAASKCGRDSSHRGAESNGQALGQTTVPERYYCRRIEAQYNVQPKRVFLTPKVLCACKDRCPYTKNDNISSRQRRISVYLVTFATGVMATSTCSVGVSRRDKNSLLRRVLNVFVGRT